MQTLLHMQNYYQIGRLKTFATNPIIEGVLLAFLGQIIKESVHGCCSNIAKASSSPSLPCYKGSDLRVPQHV